MATWKARGIVLKETPVGECDKFITLFLKDRGKVSISAKGARRAKSKFLAGTQVFTYSDFVIYDGGRFNALAQVDIIESFYHLRNNYDTLCYGAYFLELCDHVILENSPCNLSLLLLLKSLTMLQSSLLPPALVGLIFEFKFLQINGFAPELECCSSCGLEEAVLSYFGTQGLLCKRCVSGPVHKISEAGIFAMHYILNHDITDVFSFNLKENLLSELSDVSRLFTIAHAGGALKSHAFI